MTYSQAVKKACERARANHREFFVVRECGELDVCNEFDLDTFYQGISEKNILFCTSESEVSLW